MRYPFLDLKAAGAPLMEELQEAATRVIASGWYLRGEETAALEREMATLCQTDHCVAVSNGLDALRLVLRAWLEMGRVHPGDKVAVQANTYIASVLAITDSGLTPVLIDPYDRTFNLHPALLELELEKQPDIKALMPVHLYGTPCWGFGMSELIEKHNLLVLEDNAQAIGARAAWPGLHGTKTTGSLGHAAATSFYPTKNVGALGDAGCVTTNDAELAATVRALANYGSDTRYHNIYRGFNCRMDEMQAALLRVKLRHLSEETARRQAVAEAYNEAIMSPYVIKPDIDPGMRQVWHQYVVQVASPMRDAFRQHLAAGGVGTDIHYAVPPHRQPCYSNEFGNLDLPVTDTLAGRVVSLPIAPPITVDDARAIAEIINRFAI